MAYQEGGGGHLPPSTKTKRAQNVNIWKIKNIENKSLTGVQLNYHLTSPFRQRARVVRILSSTHAQRGAIAMFAPGADGACYVTGNKDIWRTKY